MLYYCHTEAGNVGDDLNPWLLPRLAPEVCAESDPTLLVGIGTILSDDLPKEPLKRVWGAGWSGVRLPRIDGRWKFYCVRGPLTAKALGLADGMAVTDPAILARRFAQPGRRKSHPVSFIPHHQSMAKADWAQLCVRVGIHCIDPRREVETVLRELQETELLLAEAMHGAILADALRVPWVPVRMYGRFNRFKWEDWAQSIEMPLTIFDLPPVYERPPSLRKRVDYTIKRGLAAAGLGDANWRRLETRTSTARETEESLRALERLGKNRGWLSLDAVLEKREATLLERLEQLRAEWEK